MNPMSIRYNRVPAIATLVVGALLLVVSALTAQPLSIFLGGVLALLGILMLVNPLVAIQNNEIRLLSPIGIASKRHPVSSPADLTIDGKNLRHVPSGKKITSLGFAHGPDVTQLRSQLQDPTG